jgi:hypothetical protein
MTENKDQVIRKLLLSANEEIVIKTLNELREKGKDNDLNTLAEVYMASESVEVKKLISQFFCDLQLQSSTDAMVRLIKTITDKPTLKMLAASCWQSRLNYSAFFELFIDLVIHESFEISFEAFTLIESFEETITEDRKKELMAYVNKNIKSCKEENLVFAGDLVKIIENYSS